MSIPDPAGENDRTEVVNPIAVALNQVVERRAARPQHVYRLAVILEGVLDSLENPEALKTIRSELHALVVEMSETLPESK